MQDKRIVTTIALVLGGIALIVVILKLPSLFGGESGNGKMAAGDGSAVQEQDAGNVQEQEIEIRASSYEWQANNQYDVEIAYKDLPDPIPAAETLQILYDPEYLRVEQVGEGDLWTNTNVLQNEIDNDVGEVMFSAGQGFDAETTGNKVLATLSITVIKRSDDPIETQIELGPESAVAAVGIRKLIPLRGEPIEVTVR